MTQDILLSRTPTTENRLSFQEGKAILTQHMRFELSPQEVSALVFFLQTVKAERTQPFLHAEEDFTYTYEPGADALRAVRITRNRRTMSMARSTAFRLLDALSGKAEGLVKDEGQRPEHEE